MSLPNFYDPQRVGQLYKPDTLAAVEAGRRAGFAPASDDQRKTVLLLVDAQVDFIHEDGALAVPGAVADTRRLIEWMYAHMADITHIAASLDSHVPIQIFFPTWWANADGEHPDPHTAISAAQVQRGAWRPLYEPDWSMDYVRKLEEDAKKQLMIWPYHVLIGTPGHTITPALYEAIAYHSAARNAQPQFLTKGTIPKTEHYSILEPEVKVPEHPEGTLNIDFLEMLAQHDTVYIAGQAKSHCVLETVISTMRYFRSRPEIIEKLNVLMDTTSSVAHPEIDFEAMAQEAFAEFKREGLTLTTTQAALGG
ncbi:MAG: hypothetical protein ACLFTK_02480 [Anaerolineales bacterium]